MNSNLKDIQFPEMNISLSLTFENPPISTEKRILGHSCLLQTKKKNDKIWQELTKSVLYSNKKPIE